MITTRESINYQFSLIFGYSSPKDEELIAGDVIGPGKLTRKKVEELTHEVIKFLRMYNAILRDYTGSEVFSIEFDLYNIDKKDAQINIYPKSMILIPGMYKDCESLLLALKPETGIMDTHKSRDTINNISRLFFEVEEFTEHPELEKAGREKVLKKFATRFSKKLYGDLIENKWNKKLIGLSTSLPTEKEMLKTYISIKADIEILWHKRPFEINILKPEFIKIKSPFKGPSEIEHIKYSISEPSASFVIENTLKLGTNLINLANTGTIDESQDDVLSYIIKHIEDIIKEIKSPHEANWVINLIEKTLNELESYLNKFLEYSRVFLNSGEMGELSEILDIYKHFVIGKGKVENEEFEEICNVAIKSYKQSIITRKELRAIELSSVVSYFSVIIKNCFNLVRKSLTKYISRRRLRTLTYHFIKNLKEKFDNEQKPARVLGHKYIEEFHKYLINKIEINPLLLSKELRFNEDQLKSEFIELINSNVDAFFDTIELKIEDLVSFAEIMMEKDNTIIKSHIDKFKKFSNELHYLLGYLLRYSTINRYIKDEPDGEITDPVTFANRFHRFLEKRIGGINLDWKSYILEWIKDYSKKFFKMEDKKDWTLKDAYNDFIGYFEERGSSEQQVTNFLEFLDGYIAKESKDNEKIHLLEFFQQYEFNIDIKTEFPKYVKSKIIEEINSIDVKTEKLFPIKFLSIDEEDIFYNYIKEMELKYFSKLIPRPLTLILKHNLTSEEQEVFNGNLFHVLNFRFWHDNLKVEVADNFNEVFREWIKDL